MGLNAQSANSNARPVILEGALPALLLVQIVVPNPEHSLMEGGAAKLNVMAAIALVAVRVIRETLAVLLQGFIMELTVKIALGSASLVIQMGVLLAQKAMIHAVLMEDSTMELSVKIALLIARLVTQEGALLAQEVVIVVAQMEDSTMGLAVMIALINAIHAI